MHFREHQIQSTYVLYKPIILYNQTPNFEYPPLPTPLEKNKKMFSLCFELDKFFL